MKIALRFVLAAALLYAAFIALVYSWMRKPPEAFAANVARLPMPAMIAFPFQTMWLRARAGTLQKGDLAPDFDLETLDRKSRVRLSAYRGSKPVVLVFGSYT